jgi:hypothetical protein
MRRRSFVATIGAVLAVPPRLCEADSRCSTSAGGLTAHDYRAYLAAFNRHDFAGFGRYYTEDVIFEGRGGNFRGRNQVLDFYRGVQTRLRESLSIVDLIVGPQGIVADVLTTLYVLQDWPDFPAGPLRKGQTVRSQNFIWYEVADGRFTHIRSAHYRYL